MAKVQQEKKKKQDKIQASKDEQARCKLGTGTFESLSDTISEY